MVRGVANAVAVWAAVKAHPQEARTSVTSGAGTCSRGDETGNAWTLNENIDPQTLQANIKANFFAIGFSVFRARVDQLEAVSARHNAEIIQPSLR